MPMRYAHQPAVIASLKIKESDTAAIERAVEIEGGLAATFDGLVGCSFGAEPTPQTRLVEGRGTDLLGLGYPGARQIVSIAVGGRWDGTAWQDEELLLPTDWTMPRKWEQGGVAAIQLMTGVWSGPVRVTAVWADQPVAGPIPADVREALTIATVKEYRRLSSSPQEMVGPDGMAIPTPSGLSDPQFKAAVARHRVRRQRAGV